MLDLQYLLNGVADTYLSPLLINFFVFFNSFSFAFLYFSALQLVCTNGATDTPLRSYLHTVKNPWPGCSSYQHTFKCLALALKASPKIVKGLKNEKGYNLQGMQNLPPCD